MRARFCLEETSFRLPKLKKIALSARIAALLDLMDQCRSDGHRILRHHSLESVELQPGVLLAELLYVRHPDLDDTLRRRLQLAIDRCQHLEDAAPDSEDASAASEVKIDEADPSVLQVGAETVREAPSIAFVHQQRTDGKAVACLVLDQGPRLPGRHLVTYRARTWDLHFIAQAAGQLRAFYREIAEIEDLDKHAYFGVAELAFPELHFAGGLSQQWNAMKQPYRQLRPMVTQHLAMLNDHFPAIFAQHKGQPDPIMREVRARFGIELSPESPGTRRNKAAIRQRLVQVGPHTLPCQWHTKLSRTAGRIHFHPGDPHILGGKLLIGLFADHLDT